MSFLTQTKSKLGSAVEWLGRHQKLTIALVMAFGLIAAFGTFASDGKNCSKNGGSTIIVGKQSADKPNKCDKKSTKGGKRDDKNSGNPIINGKPNPAAKPNECGKDGKSLGPSSGGIGKENAAAKPKNCDSKNTKNDQGSKNNNGGKDGKNGTHLGPSSGGVGKQNPTQNTKPAQQQNNQKKNK